MRNCDAYFTATSESRKGGVEAMKKMVAGVKGEAAALGREIEVFTVGQVICRPTQKEAEDYYRYAIIEQADWGTVDGMLSIKNITPATVGEAEYKKKREYFASRAIGGYPFVGSPDHVAEELAYLSRGGIRGIAFSMINYLDELPFFRDEVLPRLKRIGVRQG
jgi:dimethylsulfone monooxygenase